jgi:hypothetical protein
MMGDQEFIFDINEMFLVTVICSECHNGILFNCSNGDTGLPTACPTCNTDLKKTGQLLGDYRKFFKAVLESPHTFQFRVRAKKASGN